MNQLEISFKNLICLSSFASLLIMFLSENILLVKKVKSISAAQVIGYR